MNEEEFNAQSARAAEIIRIALDGEDLHPMAQIAAGLLLAADMLALLVAASDSDPKQPLKQALEKFSARYRSRLRLARAELKPGHA